MSTEATASEMVYPFGEPDQSRPWRWYCRICGDKDNATDRATRDAAAQHHLNTCPRTLGRKRYVGWSEHGHLAHVWSYG